MRVLIVDDEYYSRLSLQKILMDSGRSYEIVGLAESGQDAISIIEKHIPEVVLTDVRMPDVDGIQLCQWIYEYYPWIAVVIISAFTDFEYTQKAISYRARYYLLKPYEPQKILDILDDIYLNPRKEIPVAGKEASVVQRLQRLVEEEYDTDLSLGEIAEKVLYTNPSYLSRVFRQYTGLTFTEYLHKTRVTAAKELMGMAPQLTISEIASKVGYNKTSNFIKYYKRQYGRTPGGRHNKGTEE